MEKKVILKKIDRKSILLNPNYGHSSINVYNGNLITFVLDAPLPQKFHVLVLEIEEYVNGNGKKFFICKYFEPASVSFSRVDVLSEIKKLNPINLTIKKIIESVYLGPQQKYNYSYEPLFIKCAECESMVNTDDIQEEWVESFDDEVKVQICPSCKEISVFERYDCENIKDVLKEMNLE